jgi:hypothetical protein
VLIFDQVFAAAGPAIIAKDFGDELVVANLDSGLFEMLPEIRTVTEATMWRLLISKEEEIRVCANAGIMTRASRLAWRWKP